MNTPVEDIWERRTECGCIEILNASDKILHVYFCPTCLEEHDEARAAYEETTHDEIA